MPLTQEQEKARKLILEKYNNHDKYAIMAGLPGSGKSFTTRAIIDSLNLKEDEYLVGTFTGRASIILQNNGFPEAKTLHKIFYKTRAIPGTDYFIHEPKPKSDFYGIKVILVDEISMVPDNMMKTIANSGLFMIGIGDPFQLPPVGRENGMLDKPDVMLTQIMRQAEGNSIIQLAHQIRNGVPVKPFSDEYIQMVPKEEVTTGMLTWADQVLCGMNATRVGYNDIIRNELGYTGNTPNMGEKVIFLKNDWNFVNRDGNPITNGLLGNITSISGTRQNLGIGQNSYAYGVISMQPDFGGAKYEGVKYDALPFITGEQSYFKPMKGNYNPYHTLDFGHAVTVHKAQGSEFKKVLGIDEGMRGTNRARWLYTMVTRASEKLVLAYDTKNPIFKG